MPVCLKSENISLREAEVCLQPFQRWHLLPDQGRLFFLRSRRQRRNEYHKHLSLCILICHQAVPTSGQISGPYINPEDCALLSYGGPATPNAKTMLRHCSWFFSKASVAKDKPLLYSLKIYIYIYKAQFGSTQKI